MQEMSGPACSVALSWWQFGHDAIQRPGGREIATAGALRPDVGYKLLDDTSCSYDSWKNLPRPLLTKLPHPQSSHK